MQTEVRTSNSHSRRQPPFECVALLLQGGGALGAYQAGVYEALAEAGIHPNWVAGISIGAINSAIIVGNPPNKRVERLREFWDGITANIVGDLAHQLFAPFAKGDWQKGLMSQFSAGLSTTFGAPGFFAPRPASPFAYPTGAVEATSFYDTANLKGTLERLVDFDRINSGSVRLSVGAVNVRTGNFVYFDTATHKIRPEHVMASGALPPGFPPVEIDGEFYWDGGLVSNTPLEWVLESEPRQDMLAFQVDLWNALGGFPGNLAEVETRRKEIQYSSCTRAKGSYTHCMFLNDHPPIAGGRELWGFPKKLASPTLQAETDVLVGKLDYGSVRVATCTMGYKHRATDVGVARTALASPNFLLKILPHVDGSARTCELVEYGLIDITVKGAWTGPGALGLFPHALAPVAELPVLEVISAQHVLADLTLDLGSVVHDYLA